jgi:hypothetical protein
MQGHISIGRVFADAWWCFRRRYITMFLLSLVQSAWFFVSTSDDLGLLGILEIGGVAYAAAGPLFFTGSMGITIACGDRTIRAGLGRTFLYRTLPLLIDTAACLGILIIVQFGFVWLVGYFIIPPNLEDTVQGFIRFHFLLTLSLWVLTVPAVMIFVTFPASVMEENWPLQSVWRSFQLTKRQRWRILVIILILVAIFSGGLFGIGEFTRWLLRDACCETRGLYRMVGGILQGLLTWPLTLASTLVIVSTYQQLISLKNSRDPSRAVVKFG